MKKLNRKGFTLIELLAIIVILAIIMVVTIPSILDLVDSSTSKQFKNSLDAVEKWVSDQEVSREFSMAASEYNALCHPASGSKCTDYDAAGNPTGVTISFTYDVDGKLVSSSPSTGIDFITAAGQKASNYGEIVVQVKTNGRVCIMAKPSGTGDFSAVEIPAGSTYIQSNGCA